MSDVKFMDAWLTADEQEILDGWDSVVSAAEVTAPEAGEMVSGEAATELYRFFREAGWVDLGFIDAGSPVIFTEAVKRFNRRDVPISFPLIEVWLAGRLLRRLAKSQTASADYLARFTDGDELAILPLDDLFSPVPEGSEMVTGWVPFADQLTFLLPVASGGGVRLYRVPPDVGELAHVASPDPTISVWRVTLEGIEGLELVGEISDRDLSEIRNEALAATAAAMVGQAQALLDRTLEYLRTREQFGVPIGTFQALKHRCADLVTELHVANLISGYVGSVMGQRDLEPLGQMSKAFCGATALQIASEAIQMHGGMGFTWEGIVHFGFRRCSYLALAGMSVGECESALGDWVLEAPSLTWSVD